MQSHWVAQLEALLAGGPPPATGRPLCRGTTIVDPVLWWANVRRRAAWALERCGERPRMAREVAYLVHEMATGLGLEAPNYREEADEWFRSKR